MRDALDTSAGGTNSFRERFHHTIKEEVFSSALQSTLPLAPGAAKVDPAESLRSELKIFFLQRNSGRRDAPLPSHLNTE